jgi:glycosyl transferase family 87
VIRNGPTLGLLQYVPFALITLLMAPVALLGPSDVGDDYVFWAAGRIIGTGGSPYDGAAWLSASLGTPGVTNVLSGMSVDTLGTLWLYPPWTAVMFAPFGLLPKELGVPLIHLALLLGTIAALLLLVRSLQLRSPWTVALALAVGASFMPLVLAEHVGHFSALLLLGTLLVVRGLEGQTASLIAGAIVLSTKPHLFVVFAVVLAVELIATHRWRRLAPPVGAVGLLALVSFVRYPLPLDQFMRASALKLIVSFPSTGQLAQLLGATTSVALVVTGLLAVIAAVGLGSATNVLGARPFGQWPLVSRALLVSLIASLYVQVWDEALVLPALLLSLAVTVGAPAARRVPVLVGVAVIAIGAWAAYFAGPVLDTQALVALVPIGAAAVLCVAFVISPRR